MWYCLIGVNIHIKCNSAMPLFCIYQHEIYTHTSLLTCALFISSQTWKKATTNKTYCPSTAVWMYGSVIHLCHGTTTNNKKGMNYSHNNRGYNHVRMPAKHPERKPACCTFFSCEFLLEAKTGGSKQISCGQWMELIVKGMTELFLGKV